MEKETHKMLGVIQFVSFGEMLEQMSFVEIGVDCQAIRSRILLTLCKGALFVVVLTHLSSHCAPLKWRGRRLELQRVQDIKLQDNIWKKETNNRIFFHSPPQTAHIYPLKTN